MIRRVISLVRTFFDIILLRKGPDAIPRAMIFFVIAVSMWLLSAFLLVIAFDSFNLTDMTTGLLSALLGWVCYSVLLKLAGKSSRLLQTLTSVAGCGALLTVAFIVSNKVLQPLMGADPAFLIAYIILLWSVPVEGHIVSKAIDRPWYVGFAIAFAVLVLQINLDSAMNPVESMNS